MTIRGLRIWTVCGAAVALAASAAGARAEAPARVGMILLAQGDVRIEHAGKAAPARLAAWLFAGDRLATGKGSAVLLFCPSSEQLTVGGDSRVELGAAAVKVVSGPAPRRSASQCRLPNVQLGEESMERVGGMRARGQPIAVYLGGKVRSGHPRFAWHPVSAAKGYRVVLQNESGVTVWEESVTGTAVEYPRSKPSLPAGKYDWDLTAESDVGQALAQQSARFEVQPGAREGVPQPKDAVGRLLAASELEADGCYAEAAELYRALAAEHPEDARITRHLIWLYSNAGLMGAANEEMKKIFPR
jgi:hypothetical protein